MEEVVAATHAADSALLAVKLLLGEVVIIQIACFAKVCTEHGRTLDTRGVGGLLRLTLETDNAAHEVPIQVVFSLRVRLTLTFCRIMAEAA